MCNKKSVATAVYTIRIIFYIEQIESYKKILLKLKTEKGYFKIVIDTELFQICVTIMKDILQRSFLVLQIQYF